MCRLHWARQLNQQQSPRR